MAYAGFIESLTIIGCPKVQRIQAEFDHTSSVFGIFDGGGESVSRSDNERFEDSQSSRRRMSL